jgi:hypothetical protein
MSVTVPVDELIPSPWSVGTSLGRFHAQGTAPVLSPAAVIAHAAIRKSDIAAYAGRRVTVVYREVGCLIERKMLSHQPG